VRPGSRSNGDGGVTSVLVDVEVSRAAPTFAPRATRKPSPTVEPRRPKDQITVLTLSWRLDDPMAVHLIVRSTPDHPALPRGSWVVLRDFLRYGLEEPTGDAAVRIQPDRLGDRVQLRLARAGRPTWISAPCSVVRDFLDQTDVIDPTGEARSSDALDRVIAELLHR
jgi:Streptomyces sporulation and cell division protein, SsgA